MPGYDVSKPWPGSPMDGWKIAMAAVDLDHEQRGEAGSLLGGRATIGDDIKIIAPESLYVPSVNESDHGKPVTTLKHRKMVPASSGYPMLVFKL
ncbi:hypothetical protein COL26b_007404 [Colletotrichum chrysophilum]|uniref:uncharacterized protein n=1 Tax=Colletotrichum chrysophilum TaxID=1836956 RepID=UPI00230083BA|nr:uncharacterized protein COL26b_007404 [Colletotrichum chrysophilum]KAJ0374324.1 hypothetical protein COL26b_007404 [Colletotrichum chrysophilum]